MIVLARPTMFALSVAATFLIVWAGITLFDVDQTLWVVPGHYAAWLSAIVWGSAALTAIVVAGFLFFVAWWVSKRMQARQ